MMPIDKIEDELLALVAVENELLFGLKSLGDGPFERIRKRQLTTSLEDVRLRKKALELVCGKISPKAAPAEEIPVALLMPADLDRTFGEAPPSTEVRDDYILRLKYDFMFFCSEMLTIKYRPGVGNTGTLTSGPFNPSFAQRQVAAVLMRGLTEDCYISLVVLKARQLGITTVLEAFFLWLLLTRKNFHYMLIIDKDDHMYTKRDIMVTWVLECHARFPDHFPEIKKREGRVIFLTNGSQLHFESAQAGNPGTSEMLHALHTSEQTKWPAGRAATVDQSVAPSVPKQGGYFVVHESTPLGIDEFYRKFQRAARKESSDLPIFLAWFLSEEYCETVDYRFKYLNDDTELQDTYFDELSNRELTLTEEQYGTRFRLSAGQILWRRNKIKSDFKGKRSEFDKEFPTTPEHAWRGSLVGFYPNDLRMRMQQFIRAPIWVGHISCVLPDVERPRAYDSYRLSWIDDAACPTVRLWERPIPNITYYVGGDVAEGKILIDDEQQPARDSTVFRVKDESGHTVATFSSQEPAEHCWLPLVLLAIYYNLAWTNVELNGPGKTLWAFFKLTRYPHNLIQPGDLALDDLVWTRVTQANRLNILTQHRALLLANPAVCPDASFQEQAGYFGQKPGSKVAAPQGQGRHDDDIFADAHAEHCRLWHRGSVVVRAPIVEDPLPLPEREEGLMLNDLYDPYDKDWEPPWPMT